LIFSKDTKLFFDEIFIHRNFRKIVFHAIEQNPATKMYRKLIEKLGGKEVGILKENVKLTDGNYYDEVIFEIYRDVYTQVKK
jgi:RimJ/RimL family protein N-acetyltransferase